MKLIYRLFTIVLTLSTIIACSLPDDGIVIELTQENFEGTYQLSFFKTSIMETDNSTGEPVTSSFMSQGDMFDVSWEFADNSVLSITGSYRDVTTITENGEITMTETIVDWNETGNYELDVDNSTLTLLFDGESPQVFTIVDFADFGMILNFEENYEDANFSSSQLVEIELNR